MPASVDAKKSEFSFGGCGVDSVTPPIAQLLPVVKTLGVRLTFEEALKLQLALQEGLRALNAYDRRSKRNRRKGLQLTIRLRQNRISLHEQQLSEVPEVSISEEE